MAGISFSYRDGNKRADGNVFGCKVGKFFLGNSFGYRDDINYFHFIFQLFLADISSILAKKARKVYLFARKFKNIIMVLL